MEYRSGSSGGGFPGVIVAGSNAPHRIKDVADYVCETPSNNQVEITQAITENENGDIIPVLLIGKFIVNDVINAVGPYYLKSYTAKRDMGFFENGIFASTDFQGEVPYIIKGGEGAILDGINLNTLDLTYLMQIMGEMTPEEQLNFLQGLIIPNAAHLSNGAEMYNCFSNGSIEAYNTRIEGCEVTGTLHYLSMTQSPALICKSGNGLFRCNRFTGQMGPSLEVHESCLNSIFHDNIFLSEADPEYVIDPAATGNIFKGNIGIPDSP